MKTICLFCGLVLGLLLPGCQSDDPTSTIGAPLSLNADEPGVQDRIFIAEALTQSIREIERSRLGMERAENLDLRLLAQRIHDDYTKAEKQLRLIALHEGIPLPQGTVYDSSPLPEAAGGDFDRLYVREILRARDAEIKKYKAASRNARSTDIRAFAARLGPSLQEHVRLASNIARMARVGQEINEPAGAERPSLLQGDPYYKADPAQAHQFNELFSEE